MLDRGRKDGTLNGWWTMWHGNGRKQGEYSYKDAKEDGLWIYHKVDGTEDRA